MEFPRNIFSIWIKSGWNILSKMTPSWALGREVGIGWVMDKWLGICPRLLPNEQSYSQLKSYIVYICCPPRLKSNTFCAELVWGNMCWCFHFLTMGWCRLLKAFLMEGKGPCIPHIMTLSNWNIFHVTGPLWGEFMGHLRIPPSKGSDAELWSFLWSAHEQIVEQTNEMVVIWDAIALIKTLW